MRTLLELLNRLAMSVEPKARINTEFGDLAKDALTKGWLTSDFFNYGISPSGQAKRSALRGLSPVKVTAEPTVLSSVSVPPPAAEPTLEPEMEMVAVEPIPALESKPTATPRPTMKKRNGDMRQTIYNLILQHDDGITSKTLARECGIGDNAVHPHLIKLLNNHQIVRGSKPKGGQPYRYYARQNVPTATRAPEDIQSAYATQPVAAKPIAPAPITIPETREPPVAANAILDDLDLEMHALKTIITVLRPLERNVRDRVIQYATGRFEVSA